MSLVMEEYILNFSLTCNDTTVRDFVNAQISDTKTKKITLKIDSYIQSIRCSPQKWNKL